MKKLLKNATLLFCLIIVIHEIIIISDGLIDHENPKSQVAVIFGSKINDDGSISDRLKARLDKGLELYKDSLVNEIYVSGGLGKEGYSEGTVMAEYLISKGIQKNLIKIDNKGVNTRSTALNFVNDYPSESSVVLVSQYFHISRCKLSFKQVGVKKVKGVHCKHFEFRDIYAAFREFFGFYKYLIYY